MNTQLGMFEGDTMVVKARRKINARCVRKYNKAKPVPKPIMMIFPTDKVDKKHPVSARIQFVTGERIIVSTAVTTADGGAQYFEIAGNPDVAKNPNNLKLYVSKLSVQKTA